MIYQLGQVMLYVDDQITAKQFWTEQFHFQVIKDETHGDMRVIELAPENAQTSIVLYDKHLIAQTKPDLHLGTPSLMFYSNQFETLYENLKAVTTVGEIVHLKDTRVFNFSDFEGNYFAVMEK